MDNRPVSNKPGGSQPSPAEPNNKSVLVSREVRSSLGEPGQRVSSPGTGLPARVDCPAGRLPGPHNPLFIFPQTSVQLRIRSCFGLTLPICNTSSTQEWKIVEHGSSTEQLATLLPCGASILEVEIVEELY
ncbi:hypothetical protein J6590_007077 [Homalodisca vitripennis]|nr:hypothetical protein J6590_007077 [Homalodisca vitripennis]